MDIVDIALAKNFSDDSMKINMHFMTARYGAGLSDVIMLASAYQVFNSSYKATQSMYGIATQYGGDTAIRILRSDNGGDSWTSLGTVPCDVNAKERLLRIFVCPQNETILILKIIDNTASTETAEYHVLTYDNALNLLNDQNIGTNYWHAAAHNVDAYGNNVMMADYGSSTATKKLWKSTNGGTTWTDITANVPISVAIRHFHAVQSDPFTGHWWLASGDNDNQCNIWKSTDVGATWTLMGGGSQEFRTLSFVFESDYVYYGMDCPLASTPSKLFRADKTTFARTEIATTYNGNAVYSLTRTFFPAGILIIPNHEPTSVPAEDIRIQFYDFISNNLKTVAKIKRFNLSNNAYWGFNEAGRYQCKSTGAIIMELANFSSTPYYRGMASNSVTGWLRGKLSM